MFQLDPCSSLFSNDGIEYWEGSGGPLCVCFPLRRNGYIKDYRDSENQTSSVPTNTGDGSIMPGARPMQRSHIKGAERKQPMQVRGNYRTRASLSSTLLRFNFWVRKIPGEGNGYPLQYSCLDFPWTEEPGGLQSMGSQTVRHSVTFTSLILKSEEAGVG